MSSKQSKDGEGKNCCGVEKDFRSAFNEFKTMLDSFRLGVDEVDELVSPVGEGIPKREKRNSSVNSLIIQEKARRFSTQIENFTETFSEFQKIPVITSTSTSKAVDQNPVKQDSSKEFHEWRRKANEAMGKAVEYDERKSFLKALEQYGVAIECYGNAVTKGASDEDRNGVVIQIGGIKERVMEITRVIPDIIDFSIEDEAKFDSETPILNEEQEQVFENKKEITQKENDKSSKKEITSLNEFKEKIDPKETRRESIISCSSEGMRQREITRITNVNVYLRDAMKVLKRAMKLDESRRFIEALVLYQKSVNMLELASQEDDFAEKGEDGKISLAKIQRNISNVKARIDDIKHSEEDGGRVPPSPLPENVEHFKGYTPHSPEVQIRRRFSSVDCIEERRKSESSVILEKHKRVALRVLTRRNRRGSTNSQITNISYEGDSNVADSPESSQKSDEGSSFDEKMETLSIVNNLRVDPLTPIGLSPFEDRTKSMPRMWVEKNLLDVEKELPRRSKSKSPSGKIRFRGNIRRIDSAPVSKEEKGDLHRDPKYIDYLKKLVVQLEGQVDILRKKISRTGIREVHFSIPIKKLLKYKRNNTQVIKKRMESNAEIDVILCAKSTNLVCKVCCVEDVSEAISGCCHYVCSICATDEICGVCKDLESSKKMEKKK